jgi:hypothetical protein
VGSALGSRSPLTQKHYTTQSFCFSSASSSSSREVRNFHYEWLVEKFDDIKFGKVLTKLYARMYTME